VTKRLSGSIGFQPKCREIQKHTFKMGKSFEIDLRLIERLGKSFEIDLRLIKIEVD